MNDSSSIVDQYSDTVCLTDEQRRVIFLVGVWLGGCRLFCQPLLVIFYMDTTPAPLTGKQKKYLKSLAHPLLPVVQLGKEGLSAQAIAAVDIELTRHELIKVKIGGNSGLEKEASAAALVGATGGHLVQVIGKIVVLYRGNPKRAKEQRIHLPKA
jgi:RNA-binding protein